MDSAQSSVLVGLFIVSNLTTYDDVNIDSIGLYKDNGHLVIINSSKIKVDRLRNMIHSELNGLNLKVKLAANVKRVDFLHVTLNLVIAIRFLIVIISR